MVTQWFYQTAEGQQSGPIDSKELRKLVFAGIVKSNTLVRTSASGGWVRAANVPGLFQLSTPAPSPSLGASPPPIPPPVALSTSQMRQEAELARRRRADREPKATGGPPVQEPASVSVVESWASTEFGRYVLATVACGAILLLYVIACGVFEWKRGGGAIPMLMLMGAMTATWKAITGSGRRRMEQMPQSPSLSNAAQPQRPAPAVVSKSETKEATQDLVSPLAPKSFVWHAGRLFAHCRDVCTARPKILVIGACIATAGILVLIAVMLGSYLTYKQNEDLALREMKAAFSSISESLADSQDSLERIEAIDTSPKSKGTAGEMEKFMKECLNQGVYQSKQYLAELDEIGWNLILDPEHLARDTSLAKSMVIIRKAKEIVDKYTEQTNLLLAKLRNDINALNLSDVEKAKAKQAFERGMREFSQTKIQYWQLEREIVWKFEEIIDFLDRNYRNWSVSDGQLIFSTDDTVAAYNLYLGSIKNLVAQQEQLRRYGAQKVQAGLDRLRPDLDP